MLLKGKMSKCFSEDTGEELIEEIINCRLNGTIRSSRIKAKAAALISKIFLGLNFFLEDDLGVSGVI